MPQTRTRARAAVLSVLLVLAPAAAALGCLALARRTGTEALAASDPAGVLLGLAALVLAALLVWATAAAVAGVVEAWAPSTAPRPSRSTAGTPRLLPGVVQAGVTALVVAALTAPAAGAATGPAAAPVVVEQTSTAGEPGTTEDRTADEAGARVQRTDAVDAAAGSSAGVPGVAPAPGSWQALAQDGFRAPRGASAGSAALVTAQPVRAGVAAPGVEVVVLAGDSLWSIAARHLGPGADDTEVAAAWPRWWEANRAVVGDDPHLLLPGQQLVPPAP
ncbi:hypothetical protein [Aquipuribacter hungaricus]|uniref:LysM peptidoglycan-binding domain-containing protein n=1 Tax=Aquipuribacter hungaricus TaxID=545624 RepID=A0ABV7WDE1_9MICO